MLHELLLALSGFSGDIIVYVGSYRSEDLQDDGKEGFYLDDQLPFLHESEKNTIQQLCQIGFYYKKLSDFMLYYNSKSLYILAVKQGLQEILEGYLRIITKAEQEFCIIEEEDETSIMPSTSNTLIESSCSEADISDSYNRTTIMPLTYLKQLLRDYEIIFPKLLDIAKQIQKENLTGATLLDFLYGATFSGIPIIEASVQRLLYHCNVVLMKQISAWMIYGIISNQSEFFVSEESSPSTNSTLNEEDNIKLTSVNDSWNKQYMIKTDQIPTYLSLRVANKILFIGKAIKVLQTFNNISKTDRQYKLPNEELIGFKEAMKVHENTKRYNAFNFEYTIDKIRMTVGTHLWNLVVLDCELLGYIKAIKEFYFIGLGDFFLYFIEDADKVLTQATIPQHVQKDLKTLFKQASLKSSAEGYKFLDNFTVAYNKVLPSDSSTKYDTLRYKHWSNDISLEFKVGWPLNLFFTEELYEIYNDIFKLLLTAKRVQLQLTNSWIPLTRKKSQPFQELSWILLIRSKMSTFMNNLQFYLHTEVVDGEFSTMEKLIAETKDFESAKKIHNTSITKIHQRCFLNKKQIMMPVYTIFDQCLQLCDFVNMLGENFSQQHFQQATSRIEQIEKDFERNKNLLVQIAPFLFSMGETSD